MKILKKFLVVFLFSFCFLVPKVFAVTNFSTTSIFTLEAWLRNNPTKTADDYREILLSNFTFPSQQYIKSNYIIALSTASQSSTRNTIYYLSSDFYQNIAYDYNYGIPSLYFRNNNQGSYTWCYADVNYYSNGNFKNYGSWVCNTTSSWTSIMSNTFQFYVLSTNYPYFTYTTPTWNTDNFSIDNGTQYVYQQSEIPINFLNGNRFNFTVNDYFGSNEPTYSATQTLLENGNVRLDFTFENYVEGYGFTIENGVTNEEYGITNPYDSIYPNIIPFGNEYSIELSYDTYIYVTLAQYTQISGTSLYDKEVIYTDVIDINNVVFENINDPYFSIVWQNKNYLIGKYKNTQSNYTCWYKYSTDNVDTQVNCNENLDINYNINGYIKVYIKKGNNIIYERNINLLGGNITEKPYIVYEIQKQDFYSVVKWNVENENYDINLTYRYSTDGGNNFTSWTLSDGTEKQILVFDNANIIIEIADRLQNEIYDSKSITVINSINNIKSTNNTTNNIINKFKNIFNVNDKILQNVNTYWNNIKLTNLYILIFIPFITSIICCIIYLIRRK